MNIVIAAPVLAYPGVPHAGGEFLLRHIQILAEQHEVTLLVPRRTLFAQDESALPRAPCRTYMIDPPLDQTAFQRGLETLRMMLNPTSIFRGFWECVERHPLAKTALERADLVELQWFEMACTATSLRARGLRAPILGFYHDVTSQKIGRELRQSRTISRRLLRALRWVVTRHSERETSSELTLNVFLSRKDADLLFPSPREQARVAVLTPALDQPEMPKGLSDLVTRDPVVIFVAQFGRRENEESACWLVSEVWPKVLARHAEASLVLAGDGVTPRLKALLDAAPKVRSTGYLPSLAGTYEMARVAASPIRLGAGVKFKSIVPMLWGIPVVATTIGAEGIDRGLFLAVEDEPNAFAEALLAALQRPSDHDDKRRLALAEASRTYGTGRYATTLHSIYEHALVAIQRP